MATISHWSAVYTAERLRLNAAKPSSSQKTFFCGISRGKNYRSSSVTGLRSTTPEKKDEPSIQDEGESETKESLAAKLALKEAEAEALKRELASRRGESSVDLSLLKPKKPESRIDGTGFRETIGGAGKPNQQMAKWGLSEAEIFAPTDSAAKSGLQTPAFEVNSEQIVQRRLLIGLGLGAVALAASLIKLPALVSTPTKPLFFYLVPLVKLKDTLDAILAKESISDLDYVRKELQLAVGPVGALKNNLLSASTLFDSNKDTATDLSFKILEYLDQADFRRYFENRGTPTATQKEEFLKFSLQSVKAASQDLKVLLSFAPRDALEAARMQVSQFSY